VWQSGGRSREALEALLEPVRVWPVLRPRAQLPAVDRPQHRLGADLAAFGDVVGVQVVPAGALGP
jgi:hypothetical protein